MECQTQSTLISKSTLWADAVLKGMEVIQMFDVGLVDGLGYVRRYIAIN
jgi:hypothetical protein